MLLPTLARRLRSRPIDFQRWSDSAVSANEDEVASWPVDSYAVRIPRGQLHDGTDAAAIRLREAILGLRLFPSRAITLTADTADGRAADGATVVQRVWFGPFAMESAVRLSAVPIDGDGEDNEGVSLTWATLEGHPERGIETFSATQGPDGSIVITIRARSRPATLLVRLGTPFARWLQRRYSRASLEHLTAVARGAP